MAGAAVRSLVGRGRGERVDRITSNVEDRRTALVWLRIYQIYRFSIRVAGAAVSSIGGGHGGSRNGVTRDCRGDSDTRSEGGQRGF